MEKIMRTYYEEIKNEEEEREVIPEESTIIEDEDESEEEECLSSMTKFHIIKHNLILISLEQNWNYRINNFVVWFKLRKLIKLVLVNL